MGFTEKLNFDEKGLIPAVIQDRDSNEVLTLCYMSREALGMSLETGKVHVFRRSKGRVMIKGETVLVPKSSAMKRMTIRIVRIVRTDETIHQMLPEMTARRIPTEMRPWAPRV